MEMREPVEKQHGEADDYRNDAEPDEYERPLVLSRRRSGNPEHQGESTKYVSQKFDHGYSVGDAGLKPSAYTVPDGLVIRDHSSNCKDQACLLVIQGWARLLRYVGVYYDAAES
jgi:hypothetical protein